MTDRTDEIADAIEKISGAAQQLLDGHLNERAVVLLIQHACPAGRGRPSQRQIKAVLHAAKNLDVTYLRLDENE